MSERSVSPTAPNPNQPDLSKLSPEEIRIYKLYGKLPSKQDILKKKLKDRKYFDSGDYALNKIRTQQQQLQQQEVEHNKAQEEGQQISGEHKSPDLSQRSTVPRLSTSNSSSSAGGEQHGSSLMNSPTKIPDDDFISSDQSHLPLPFSDVEKIVNLQKKKSITRHGSIISTTNKEITGISSKSSLETEVASDDC